MPITCEIPMRSITRSEFNRIDQAVMACSYQAQNHFGRLCEEEVYENDLKKRLLASGISDVHTQIEVWVTHGKFEKLYLLDLVANRMLYELKAVSNLNTVHEAQALNYAALLNLSRVKLINFGGTNVTGKLLGTPFGEIDRSAITVDYASWHPVTPACEHLASQFEELIRDIGGFLEAEIYDEAMIYLCGGEATCLRRMAVSREGIELGHQRCRIFTDNAAFVISTEGNHERFQNYGKQLQSLLNALPISVFQWINIHHTKVTFTTLRK